MKTVKLFCGVLGIVALLGLIGCTRTQTTQQEARASAPQVIRIGHGSVEHPDHPVTIACYALKDYIEEHSNGRYEVRIFPGSQLGTGVQQFEMVQMGTLDITIFGIPNIPMFSDAVGGMDMPYLFRGDYDLMYQALSGPPGREMLTNLEADTGIKALGYGFHVWRHFFMRNRPIRSLADCQGQLLRVMESPIQRDIFMALGFSPVAMSLSELYQAMNQGTIDGATFDMIGGVTEKYDEVVSYVTKSGHICFGSVMAMSDRLFSSLSPEDQQLFIAAGAYAEEETYRRSVELEADYEKQLEALGVEIIEIDLEPFYAAVQPVIDRYTAQSPRIKAFVDAVTAMR